MADAPGLRRLAGGCLGRPRLAGQVAAWGAAGSLVLLVGASRIYLGAHWLTDVLAGYLLGGAWLFLLLRLTASSGGPPIEVPGDGLAAPRPLVESTGP